VFWCFVGFSVQLIHLLIIVLLIHKKKNKTMVFGVWGRRLVHCTCKALSSL